MRIYITAVCANRPYEATLLLGATDQRREPPLSLLPPMVAEERREKG